MGWFIRFTRFGDSHLVFSQEQDESCGLASCKMAVFKINKLRPGGAALTTERNIERIYRRYAPTHAGFDREGSTTSCIVNTLNDLGIGNWQAQVNVSATIPALMLRYLGSDAVGAGSLINGITRGFPVILGVDWLGADGRYHGGHWVLVDTVNRIPMVDRYWASVCDPWDGNVHITRFQTGTPFRYEADSVPVSFSFGGAEHRYTRTGIGIANDIIYCTRSPGFFG